MTTDPAAPDNVPDTTPQAREAVLAAAATAAPAMAAAGPLERAGWLRGAADALDAAVDELVPVARHETGLPEARLRGEVTRSTGQLRLFADEVLHGSLLEVVIDTADPDASPVPRPDLRRVLVPLGPVLVFAASNFPFAFSVCGGDTASALAAGCPVVVKAHPGHPVLSEAVADVMVAALAAAGAPVGALGLVHGQDAGVDALRDPRVKASGFTGSVAGGVALHQIAVTRSEPIPFYGELGSLNPAFVLPAAARERGSAIASGFVGSFTLGVGQFCTKPGLLFLPQGHGLEDELVAQAEAVAPAPMLNSRIRGGYDEGLARLRGLDSLETLLTVPESGGEASASLLRTTAAELVADSDAILEECFGPVAIVVEYADTAELEAAAAAFAGSLTASVHAAMHDEADEADARRLLPVLEERVGRVVWNGWPTGVAVARAMHHGGPFPATVGSVHTSVGTTAARRFQRPICFQDTPDDLLPEVLRDHNTLGIIRRIDGEVSRADVKRSR